MLMLTALISPYCDSSELSLVAPSEVFDNEDDALLDPVLRRTVI